jgi:hypothetical protein
MQCTDENNVPGLFLFIDFEKAFDLLFWSFVQNTLSLLTIKNGLIFYIKMHFLLLINVVFFKKK